MEAFGNSLLQMVEKSKKSQDEAKKKSWRRPDAVALLVLWPWLSAVRGTGIKWVTAPFSLCLAPALGHAIVAVAAGVLLMLRHGKQEFRKVFSIASVRLAACYVLQGMATGLKNVAYSAISPAVVNSLLYTSVLLSTGVMFVKDRKSLKQTQALAVLGTVLAALAFALAESGASVRAAGPLIIAVALGAAALEAVCIELSSLTRGAATEESASEGAQLQDAVSACVGITVGCLVVLPAIDLQHSMEHGLFSGIDERMILFTVLPHVASSIVQMTLVSLVGPVTVSLVGSLDIVAAFVLTVVVSSPPPNLSLDIMLLCGPVLCSMMHYIGVLDVDSAAMSASAKLLTELQETHKPATAPLPTLLTAFKNRMSVMVSGPSPEVSKPKPAADKAPAAAGGDAFASSASDGIDLGSLEDYSVSL